MGLGFIFTARNLASGTMNRLNGQLGRLGNRSRVAGVAMAAGFGIAATGVASLVAGIGLLGTSLSLAGASGNFSQQMNLVGELAGATGERLENLRNAAVEAGLATKFSPDEAVEGLRNLITAGLQAEQAAEALVPSLQVAEFGMISVADAGAAVVGSMNAFRSQGLSAQQIADRFATAMARTNFQAQDFDVGLSSVAGTAGMFNQTLDTTLVGLGLLRNMNIQASRAATGLREAIRRLGSDARSQEEAFKLIGREGVFEGGTGGLRNILEIMEDLRASTESLTEAERNATIVRILGSRGVQTFAAVMGAEFRRANEDGTTTILRGIEAARELERQMGESAGMARRLQQAVSEGNYAGIVNVLKGVAQTLVIEMGRPFAEVLIPVVIVLRDSLAALTRFVNRLPGPFKRMGAAAFLLSGVMFTVGGIVAIVTGLIVVLLPFIKILAIVFGVLTAALVVVMGPIMAVIGALALLRQAFILNVGGIADFFRQSFERVRLTFNALRQLFSQGGFSGDVRDEMNRAENQGIRNFVISIFRIWGRIQEFFRGVKIGFSQIARTLGPTFEVLKLALTELARSFGFLQDGTDGLADSNMDTWAETGARVGGILADVLDRVVKAIIWVVNTSNRAIAIFKEGWSIISPLVSTIADAFSDIGSEISATFKLFINEIGISTAGVGGFTGALRFVVQTLVLLMRVNIAVTGFIIRAFVFLFRQVMRVGFAIRNFYLGIARVVIAVFRSMIDYALNNVDRAISLLGRLFQMIPGNLRSGFMDDIIRAGQTSQDRIAERGRAEARRNNELAQSLVGREGPTAAEEQARATARSSARDEQIATALDAIRTERRRDREEATRPINISIDGEVVASAVNRNNRTAGARGFGQVPANAD